MKKYKGLKEDYSKSLVEILTEMCKRVNVDYADIDFHKDYWFCEHYWTEAEQEDFCQWLTDYLNNNKEARQEFDINTTNKNIIQKQSKMFCFNYGWKFQENNNNNNKNNKNKTKKKKKKT